MPTTTERRNAGLSWWTRLKRNVILGAIVLFALFSAYQIFWGQYVYTITAYCNCPICINQSKYHDGKFASGKSVYWGGVASDAAVPFGTQMELLPLSPKDWMAVMNVLNGRRKFVIEDRGGKINGKHIDIFIPDSLGGHQAARRWGVRRMRIKLNGELAV